MEKSFSSTSYYSREAQFCYLKQFPMVEADEAVK
jgi:hypothetical protein